MKRILSMLLCMVLVLGMIPVFASAAEETATISFASTAHRKSQTTSKQVWENGGITFTNNKGSSTTNVADYVKPVRLYANSEIVVDHAGMTQILFDCNSSSYATALKESIGTVSGATVIVSSDKVTVKFTSAVNTFKVAKLTGQVRLDSLTVTYTVGSEGGSTEEPECEHPADKLTYEHNDAQHWQKCSCGEYTTPLADHDFSTSDICVCGYEKPVVPAGKTYAKYTASTLVTGEYILVTANGYAPGVVDDTWISAIKPSKSGDNYTDANGGVWTVTVTNGNTVELKDANGVVVGPKEKGIEIGAGKTWKAVSGSTAGTFYFTSEDGKFFLSSNHSQSYKFRAYADKTGDNGYSQIFTVYKLVEATPALPKVEKTNTRFGQDQSLLFAYKASNLGSTTGLVAKITKADGTLIELNNWTTATIEDETYYVIELAGIAGKEMTDEFTIVIMNGEEAVTQTETMSLRDYAMSVLDDCGDEDAEYRTLIVDMLNYGAAAQTKFNYNIADLANSKLSTTQRGYASNSIATISGERTVSGEEVFGGTNLRFNDKINMLFQFEISLDTYAEITWENHKGEPQTVTVTSDKYAKNGTYYVVELAGLVVADGRQEVTCTIKNTSNNSVVAVVTDSVMWNYSRLNDGDEYKALYEAFMKYADSAYAYMH